MLKNYYFTIYIEAKEEFNFKQIIINISLQDKFIFIKFL